MQFVIYAPFSRDKVSWQLVPARWDGEEVLCAQFVQVIEDEPASTTWN